MFKPMDKKIITILCFFCLTGPMAWYSVLIFRVGIECFKADLGQLSAHMGQHMRFRYLTHRHG